MDSFANRARAALADARESSILMVHPSRMWEAVNATQGLGQRVGCDASLKPEEMRVVRFADENPTSSLPGNVLP